MPIYEYVCPDCDTKFEMLRRLSQSDEGADCPQCGKTANRVLSSFCCFSKDESGLITPTGGGACSSCSAGTCSTCGM